LEPSQSAVCYWYKREGLGAEFGGGSEKEKGEEAATGSKHSERVALARKAATRYKVFKNFIEREKFKERNRVAFNSLQSRPLI